MTDDPYEGLALTDDEKAEATRLGLSEDLLLAAKFVAAKREAGQLGFSTVRERRAWEERWSKARVDPAKVPLTALEQEAAARTGTDPKRYAELRGVRNVNDWLALQKKA